MVTQGTLYLSQYGTHYEVGANQFIYLRAGEEHYGYQASSGKLSYLWVHFYMDSVCLDEATVPQHINDLMSPTDFPLILLPEYGNVAATQKAPLLFHQLLDFSREETPYAHQITNHAFVLLAMEMTHEFLEHYLNAKKFLHPAVTRIAEWIKANYYHSLTVPEIAEEFGYTADYLSSLFHRYTGFTLIHYINKIRIDSSKNLLTHYDVTVKEAAFSSGYQDEKYYMKMFKKQEGMTPTQYKKAFYQKMINQQRD